MITNADSRRYAMKRVNEIQCQKEAQIKQKHTKTAISPTDKDMINAIEWGDVRLIAKTNNVLNKTVREAFDFSRLEVDEIEDNKKIIIAVQKSRIEADKVRDQIMLGDETEALKLLEKFNKS